MVPKNNTANSIDMSIDKRRLAVLDEAIRRNLANARVFVQRALPA